VSNRSIGTVGKIAIALAVIAGVLSLSRAIYNYTQHGEVDFGKIALGIGMPILIYVIVKGAASGK
jgi:SpoU rRNA methylase family enzyme